MIEQAVAGSNTDGVAPSEDGVWYRAKYTGALARMEAAHESVASFEKFLDEGIRWALELLRSLADSRAVGERRRRSGGPARRRLRRGRRASTSAVSHADRHDACRRVRRTGIAR